MQRSDVYDLYANFMKGKARVDDVVSSEAFMKMWRREFPHVQLRKKSSIFNKCRTCEDLAVGLRDT